MRILIIADEKAIRDLVKVHLKSRAFAVDTAKDGKEGSRLALVNDYDLIVLDAELPERPGIEVCKGIRKGKKDVLILILTVKSDIRSKVAFLGECEADDYLIKPFSPTELLLRVKALLRRQRQPLQGDTLRCGNLILDTGKHEVTKAGEEVELTRKEYGMLRLLMRNKGALLSQSMIFEHVWNEDTDPFSTTVETHIRSLRKKLGDEDKTLIKTLRGRGYKIKCPEEQDIQQKS
ncbi:MAG: response regulator transcription factor [Thermodesulfobacteriota bacterium]